MEFCTWLERIEEEKPNPFSPFGHGFTPDGTAKPPRRQIINHIPPAEVQHLHNARQALDQNDLRGCLDHVRRAMEVYTSSGIKGDRHPTYRILNMLYEKLKETHPFGVYKQLVDIVLKQVQGELSNLKMK